MTEDDPLGWPWEAQSSPRVARESWGWRSSHCRAEETSPKRVSGCFRPRGRRSRSPLVAPGAELGQESQASSCLRKGTPLASRVAQGVSGPSSSCVWNPRSLRTMHGSGSVGSSSPLHWEHSLSLWTTREVPSLGFILPPLKQLHHLYLCLILSIGHRGKI